MAEMKVRKPKPVVEVTMKKIENIEVTEIFFQIDQRHNMELYHPGGKFSGVGTTFGAKATVIPGTDLETAKEELINFVTETFTKQMTEQIDELLAIIKNQ
jgi:hypothetical protein